MGEIRLFHRVYGQIFSLESDPFPREAPLHDLIERHLLEYLGVCFLKHEVVIGASELGSDEEGRIDTLGIDSAGCPVIVEYKRGSDRNVVQQILDYREWLLKNKPMFRELVRESDQDCAKKVSWQPRLIVIAGEVTQRNVREARRDKENSSIELIHYRRFGNDHLMLEWVYGERPAGPATVDVKPTLPEPVLVYEPKTFPSDFSEYRNWDRTSEEVKALFQGLLAFAQTLGEMRLDVFATQFSFRRMRGEDIRHKWPPVFAQVRPNITSGIRVEVLERTQSAPLEEGFTTLIQYPSLYRVFIIYNRDDLEKAKPLLRDAYERY